MSGNSYVSVSPSRKWVLSLAVLGATALGASQADAGTSVIRKSKRASEATHEQVLENRYGGDFVKSGDNFSNGVVSVSRMDDDNGAEQVWRGNFTSATAVAAFARREQSFGYFDDNGFNELFTVAGKNFNVSGTGNIPAGDTEVVFGRGPDGKVSSLQSANRRNQDHLVSYQVSGLGSQGNTFLLFWEDAISGSDFDYNDLVVELRGGSGQALLIPLPTAAWSGLVGLAGLGVVSGWKRFRRGA